MKGAVEVRGHCRRLLFVILNSHLSKSERNGFRVSMAESGLNGVPYRRAEWARRARLRRVWPERHALKIR